MKPKHLWEVSHSYYCNQGNYFNNDCGKKYKSFADFLTEEGNNDMDYNLIFRWDWSEDDGNGNSTFNGDRYYKNGKLKLFWMGQRKGLYRYTIVDVCRADETEVIKFLEPRWEYLRMLWEPFI